MRLPMRPPSSLSSVRPRSSHPHRAPRLRSPSCSRRRRSRRCPLRADRVPEWSSRSRNPAGVRMGTSSRLCASDDWSCPSIGATSSARTSAPTLSTCVRRPGARETCRGSTHVRSCTHYARLASSSKSSSGRSAVRSHLVGGRWAHRGRGVRARTPTTVRSPTAAGSSARRAPRPDHRLEIDGSNAVTKLLLAVVALTVVFGLGPARAEMLSPTSPLGPTYRLKSTLRPQNVVGPRPHVSRSAKGVFSAELRPRWNMAGRSIRS